jgi:hypothetical protein
MDDVAGRQLRLVREFHFVKFFFMTEKTGRLLSALFFCFGTFLSS